MSEKRGTVLVAEDDRSVRTVCGLLLEQAGYTVHTAANGRLALDELEARAHEIDLVLSDYQMPLVDGPTLLTMVAERWSHIALLLTSALTETRLRAVLAQCPEGTLTLLKPYSRDELLKRVGDSLRAPRVQR